jgi:hypothetical protein
MGEPPSYVVDQRLAETDDAVGDAAYGHDVRGQDEEKNAQIHIYVAAANIFWGQTHVTLKPYKADWRQGAHSEARWGCHQHYHDEDKQKKQRNKTHYLSPPYRLASLNFLRRLPRLNICPLSSTGSSCQGITVFLEPRTAPPRAENTEHFVMTSTASGSRLSAP